MTSIACSLCTATAISVVRLTPTRTDTPLTDDIRRALVWPGVESPVSVHACKKHLQAVKSAGRVIGQTSLGEGVVSIVFTDAEPAA